MSELAGDECIIRKRATRFILPRKSPRDRFCTLDTERVTTDVEGGQRGVDLQHLGNNFGPRRTQLVLVAPLDIELLQCCVRL